MIVCDLSLLRMTVGNLNVVGSRADRAGMNRKMRTGKGSHNAQTVVRVGEGRLRGSLAVPHHRSSVVFPITRIYRILHLNPRLHLQKLV